MESMCRTYILGRRVATGIFCSIALQYVFLSLILLPLKLNFIQPETWFHTVLNISTYGVIYIFPLCTISIVEGMVSSEDGETEIRYCGTRFSILRNIFSLRNILMAFLHTLMGGFFFYFHISLFGGDYSNLSTICKDTVFIGFNCLVESYVFLITCGFWMGFYFYLQVYILGSKHTIPPVVQQSKIHQIKSQLKPAFKQALYDTIFPSFLFVLIYYCKGNSVREKICELFYLQFEDEPITSLFVFLHVGLLLYSWFLSTLFLTTMNIVRFIIKMFLTGPMSFPVVPAFGETKYVTLHEALSFTNSRGIQYLGYQDLRVLAEKDQQRREDLFSLSQPGGHPRNWNAIVEDCLKLINEFTTDMNKGLTHRDTLTSTDIIKSVVKPSSAPVVETHNKSTSGLRNLLLKWEVQRPPNSSQSLKEIVVERLVKKLNSLQITLLKKPGISYVFAELPDAKIKFALCSRGQLVLWAVESLALLAAASFHEDKYGVLQKDLPAIITSLLQLKQILDKLQKVGNYKKTMKSESYEIRVKHALKSSVKRSLYRITVTFGNYVNELPLSVDSMHQIQNFILYKE